MDDIVRAAMAKWPRVPHCYGWLALDARGRWWLRDEPTQAAGAFPAVRGSLVEHDKLVAFIHRNYDHDDRGAWFFQNGPQRVYVELEAAPHVWRVDAAPGWPVRSHTGVAATVRGCAVDEHGRVFLDTDIGYGIVHTLDTGIVAQAIEAGDWQPVETPFDAMPARYGYRLQPAPAADAD